MKFPATLSRLFSGAVFTAALVLSATVSPAAVEATDLRCEYLVNPLGIDETAPRLGWRMSDAQQTRGQKQTAYQLIVASSPEILSQDKGDLWDSGKVESAQSTLVPYGGTALNPNQDCHWKVRVFDKDGVQSDWSEPARFSIGLLTAEDLDRLMDQTSRYARRREEHGLGCD